MPSSNPISYGQGKLSTKITSNSINPTHSSGTLISSTPKKYERTPIKPLIDGKGKNLPTLWLILNKKS